MFGEYALYCWCSQCQRVNMTGKWADNDWRCPSADCSGRPDDAWRWEEVRAVDPDFPNHPILGRVYKLYAFDWEIECAPDDDAANSRSSSMPSRSP
jgi:hypothetical protein